MNWIPLESNPDVLNSILARLKITNYEFQDVFGFEQDLLSMLSPVKSVILLFPVSQVYQDYCKQEQTDPCPSSVYFMKQTIGNACGMIAVLHSIMNTIKDLGELTWFYNETKNLDPDQRADYLKTNPNSKFIADLHQETSEMGQTETPDANDDVELHFVSFVNVDGVLYELDGRKDGVVNHGVVNEFLPDCVKVIKSMMQRDPENLNFTAIALTSEE